MLGGCASAGLKEGEVEVYSVGRRKKESKVMYMWSIRLTPEVVTVDLGAVGLLL